MNISSDIKQQPDTQVLKGPPQGAPESALQPLSLRANFSWTFVGNVVYAGCQWAMLVLLAKLTSSEKVGQFALGLAITAPVIMFLNMQLRAVQATDARQQYRFGHYLSLRLVTTILALLVIACITLLSNYEQDAAIVVIGIGFAKGFESLSDIVYGLLQQRERMDRIAKSMIIRGILSLVMLGVGVYLGGIVGGVVGMALAWMLVLLVYDIPSGALAVGPELDSHDSTQERYGLRPSWELGPLARLAWLSLPLGFVMMLISLNTNIPRYFIERYYGQSALGIFAALAYLMVAGRTVVTALGQSASPRLAKHYSQHEKAVFLWLFIRLLIIGALLGISALFVVLIMGRQVLTLLYKAEYGDHADVFALLTLAASIEFVAAFAGFGLTAARYFRSQVVLYGVVTVVTLLASLVLVPEYGLHGAAYTLLISGVVQLGGGLAIVIYAIQKMHSQEAEGLK